MTDPQTLYDTLVAERLAMFPSLPVQELLVTDRGRELLPDYEMGYGTHLDVHRVEQFMDGKLDINQLACLAQDMIEGGRAKEWGPHAYGLILHCLENGLATVSGRVLQ